ncbi:hypothetical protein GCM10007276_30350 [Agaricicola taiwanensis]|uniref:Uncharacterized protein n=1 Tax=Agaricicola taiwanensis TaxID=591372 RepID=A0A8J3DZC8_9RHOB|nr:hypothetical protein [Agaricicola taiwanensis]GGE51218.1 hypothetical protein GCM10007276_30350 [Agaricicola taiwanensis]
MTERARKAAAGAGFGAWERSLRVNEHLDKDGLLNGAMLLFLAPWVFLAMGFFMPQPMWSKILCIAVGLTFLCFGIVLFWNACLTWRSGHALIHLSMAAPCWNARRG